MDRTSIPKRTSNVYDLLKELDYYSSMKISAVSSAHVFHSASNLELIAYPPTSRTQEKEEVVAFRIYLELKTHVYGSHFRFQPIARVTTALAKEKRRGGESTKEGERERGVSWFIGLLARLSRVVNNVGETTALVHYKLLALHRDVRDNRENRLIGIRGTVFTPPVAYSYKTFRATY